MSWEQRNRNFSNAQVDAQVAYIEAEREVKRLQTENAKLRELCKELYESAWLEYPSAFEHSYADRLRELGVEV